jgi:hypothetical protein
MTDDVPTSPYPAPLPDLGLTADEKRTIALILIGCVAAFALGECARRIERRFARRHPLLTEIVEGTAHHPPHRR